MQNTFMSRNCFPVLAWNGPAGNGREVIWHILTHSYVAAFETSNFPVKFSTARPEKRNWKAISELQLVRSFQSLQTLVLKANDLGALQLIF